MGKRALDENGKGGNIYYKPNSVNFIISVLH
jgi:hypothetical protein